MHIITKTAYANRPNGDNGSEIVDKINKNMLMLTTALGGLGKSTWFGLGDSMTGYGMGSGYASFLGMARLYSGDPEVYFNEGSYFNGATGEAFPGGPQGFQFGVGGTNVQHLIDVQMRHVRIAYEAGHLPRRFILNTWQNNRYYLGESYEQSCLEVIGVLNELVDTMGCEGIVIGPWPHSQLAAGAWSKHYIDQRMKEWAATKPGIRYISILDAIKSGNPAEEASGQLNYGGWQLAYGMVGRFSWDEIHAAPTAQYCVGLLVGAALRSMARPYQMPSFSAGPYDKVKNPLGNIMGAQGRLYGSGGNIVNIADPDATKWTRIPSEHLPAGVDLYYDHSKGIGLTPNLSGNDRNRELRITATGPATVDLGCALRFGTYVEIPTGFIQVAGKGRWDRQNGWAGVTLGNAGQGAPGMPPSEPITSYRGHGGYGGADYVMPFEMNDPITFRSMPSYYNQPGRVVRMDLGFGFAKDVPVSGSLVINKLGMFTTGLPAGFEV